MEMMEGKYVCKCCGELFDSKEELNERYIDTPEGFEIHYICDECAGKCEIKFTIDWVHKEA